MTRAGDTTSQQPLTSQGDASGPCPTQGTCSGAASQPWRQCNLQYRPTVQPRKAVSQDGRGQCWAQTYLKLTSGEAWVPGHEFKASSWAHGQRVHWWGHQWGWSGRIEPTVAHSPLAMRSLLPYVKHSMFIMTSFNSNHLCASAGHLPWPLILEQPLLQYLSSFFFNGHI